ncbi:hypothetical protein LTR85_008584 [Meristemomyces frigidus]|nr:hypothetical protein LTR85_008584 [Meristemomyces frigidus]
MAGTQSAASTVVPPPPPPVLRSTFVRTARNRSKYASGIRPEVDKSQLYLQSWFEKDAGGVSEVIRGALEQQEQLELLSASLDGLAATSVTAECTTRTSSDAATRLKDSAPALRALLSTVVHPSFYNERHSITSLPTRVQDVLELPELLEIILCNLSLQNVLTMQQVSKTTFSSIQQSPKL